MKLLPLLLAGAALVACSPAPSEPDPRAAEIWAERMTREAVLAKLRDPASATFSNVHTRRVGTGVVTCGYVNSRNGYGGMSGPHQFVGAGSTTFLEEEVGLRDMAVVWSELCAR